MMLAVLIGLFFVFVLLGMEIAWAIGVASLGYIVIGHATGYGLPLVLISKRLMEGIDAFVLIAIPLFIFAGELMNFSGVTTRIINFASAFVGHWRGGLANVGVTANFIMSGCSGSALADCAATGTVLVPEMKKRGFKPTFASAVIAAAATVGPIVPPSISFVLLGAIAQISVGQLFLGGIVPGTLMFIAMFILTWWICRQRGDPVEPKASWKERRHALIEGVLALVAPAIIVGSIIFAIATPTESAAIAVAYVLVLGLFIYRSLNGPKIMQAASASAVSTAVILLTVANSSIFAVIAVREGLGVHLTEAMFWVSREPWAVLIMINILLLLLGMIMDILPIMLIIVPVLFPQLPALGIDEIHFGVMMVLNLMIGMITPPVGLNLFVISAISGEGVLDIFREAVPYFCVLVAVLALVTYLPELTLTIPRMVFPQG